MGGTALDINARQEACKKIAGSDLNRLANKGMLGSNV
jgi:hypothetical protein